jgi:hypothetical protein
MSGISSDISILEYLQLRHAQQAPPFIEDYAA